MYSIDEATAKAALFSFIKEGNITEATNLLDVGVPANAIIDDQSTNKSGLISYVITNLVSGSFDNGCDGKVAFLAQLINNGASVNKQPNLSLNLPTPLMECMFSQMDTDLKLKVLDLLLLHHADPLVTASLGNNIVHTLVRSSNIGFLPSLFERLTTSVINELLQQRNDEGYTPLHIAVRAASMGMGLTAVSHIKYLKILAQYQSDLETVNNAQESILKDFERFDSRHSTQLFRDLQAHKIASSCDFDGRTRVPRAAM